jgi:hypothetical protein
MSGEEQRVYTVKCGSELARDEALPVSGHVACNTAIASKLAPTGIEYICQSQVGRKATSRDRAHTLENDQDAQALSNQAGWQAASLLILRCTPPREAERRFCAVGTVAGMPR